MNRASWTLLPLYPGETLDKIARRLAVEPSELLQQLKAWNREGKVKYERGRWYRERVP
jgi:predicted Rossmann fold nucleotide-binding protein DprA/Smf involved in DNA uptake